MREQRLQKERTWAANPKLETSDPWPMKTAVPALEIELVPALLNEHNISISAFCENRPARVGEGIDRKMWAVPRCKTTRPERERG